MKSFGRLLMAAALIVPAAAVVTAQSAGAAPPPSPDNVTCATNTGTLKFNPGVSLTHVHGQVVTNLGNTSKSLGTGGVLDGCTGIGITDSTGGALYFKLGGSPVDCKTIKGKTFIGGGQIKWNVGGSNEGVVTHVKLRIKFNSYTGITFAGSVASTDPHTYLYGGKIRGTASIPPNLRSAGNNGGTCGNNKAGRVKTLAWTNTSDFTINVPAT
jgi:hypothetical protein